MKFDKDYGHYDDRSKDFIRALSLSLNKAIDSFESMGNEWKDVYKDLKSHDTKKGWVKRFFVVEEIKNS